MSVEGNILNLDLDQLEESLDPTTLFSDKTGLATIGLKAITLKVKSFYKSNRMSDSLSVPKDLTNR